MTTLAASDVIAFDKTTLDNGLRVVTSAMPHTRAVSIGLWYRLTPVNLHRRLAGMGFTSVSPETCRTKGL